MTHCRHCAQPIPYGDILAIQSGPLGMWQAIVAYEAESNPAGEPTPLRQALHRIVDEQPGARAAFAVNTTRIGRPLDEVTPFNLEQAA